MKTQKRRRKERKTDYGKRFKLLKSGIPRIIFRKTNKYVLAQYAESKEAKDEVKIGFDSRELLKYGWPEKARSGLKSLPASYLVGFLMGKRIKIKKLKNPIADFGMMRALHKSKIFAFINGLIDSGIEIKCEKKAFPDESRIKGENLKNKIPFEEIKSKINKEK